VSSTGALTVAGITSTLPITGTTISGTLVTANAINLTTSITSANPNTNRVAHMPMGADVAVTANTWTSVNFLNGANITINGTSALGDASWIVSGNIIIQTQVNNTAAIVTVKLWSKDSDGASLGGLASSEVTIPAISGVKGVATIPINALLRSRASFASAILVFDVYSTAEVTVKRFVPDNATGDSLSLSTSSGDGTSFTFLKVKG
jgi:hypothetical protein